MAYVFVDKIAHVRLLCKKVLPAVYDESLSYLEGLSKLTYKLNETITSVNTLNDNVDILNDSVIELNDRVTDVEGEIEGFEAEVTQRVAELEASLTAKIDDSVSDMQAEIDGKLATVDDKLDEVNQRIADMEQYVRDTVDELTARFEVIITAEIQRIEIMYASLEQDLRNYIQQEFEKIIKDIPDLTNIYVISPVSGKLVKVQVAVNEIFNFSLYNALTCDEYNDIGLTCDELNALMVDSIPRGLTIHEWLHDAKKLLIDYVDIEIAEKWAQAHSIVRNYLNGNKVWLEKNVDINESMWAWGGSFTADEIALLGFTCDEIIAYNISCTDYILKANEIMVAS